MKNRTMTHHVMVALLAAWTSVLATPPEFATRPEIAYQALAEGFHHIPREAPTSVGPVWERSPGEVKNVLDRIFCTGVNRINHSAAIEPITIPGPWTVDFLERPQLGKPFSANCDTLKSWTESENRDEKYFSGTARYTTSFVLDENQSGGRVKFTFSSRFQSSS